MDGCRSLMAPCVLRITERREIVGWKEKSMGVGKHGQSSQRPFVRPRTARVDILQNSGKLTIHKGRSLRAEEFEAQNMLARKRGWREEGVCERRRDSLRGRA